MKLAAYILCSTALLACHGRKSTATINIAVPNNVYKPYKLNKDYIVIDTGFFYAPAMQNVYAVVQHGNIHTDTIVKYVGMQKINAHSYLYLNLTGTGPLPPNIKPKTGYQHSIKASLSNYMIVNGQNKQALNNLAKNFDDFFSSPHVIKNLVCFWQLNKSADGKRINYSAAAYNPGNGQTLSYPISRDILGADESGYLPPPYLQNDTIYFDLGQHLIKLSPDFKPYN